MNQMFKLGDHIQLDKSTFNEFGLDFSGVVTDIREGYYIIVNSNSPNKELCIRKEAARIYEGNSN